MVTRDLQSVQWTNATPPSPAMENGRFGQIGESSEREERSGYTSPQGSSKTSSRRLSGWPSNH